MINKMKAVRDRISEKTKLIIYISAAAFVFVVSCLLPLAFRGEIISDGIFDTGERAVVFSRYMNKDDSVKVKVITKTDKAEEKYCRNIFEELYAEAVLDEKDSKASEEGCEFLELKDGINSMRVCHMWLQNQGDWTNWVDVYIDVDTGFVYYLYVSSICLKNPELYYDAAASDFNARNAAEIVAERSGFALKILSWSGKAEDTATAYTALDGEAIIWNINCSYYPSSLMDLKISVA